LKLVSWTTITPWVDQPYTFTWPVLWRIDLAQYAYTIPQWRPASDVTDN